MTTQKTGRNDACPCGSGAKYKRCCLAKDDVARREQAARPPAKTPGSAPEREPRAPGPPAAAAPPRELTPDERWWQAWDENMAKAQGGDARLELARHALREAPEPDGEFLYESFDPVLMALERADRHAERIELIEQIEARFSRAFQYCAHYFAHTRFESALELPGADLVEEARRMGPHVVKVLDLISPVPVRLAWEGSVAALRALTEAGWPGVRDRVDLFDWAVDEWAGLGIGAVLIDHVEREPNLAPDDPALRGDLALYETHREGDDSRSGDDVVAYAQRWLRWLKPAPDLPAVASVLERLGREDDEPSFEHAANVVACIAARLRAERGWTRSQGWVLLRAMPALLRDCAQRSRAEGKKGLGALLLPPPKRFVERLFGRNVTMFAHHTYQIEAVVLTAPVWAGTMAARGWASDKAAHDWQRQVMGELAVALQEVPDDQRDEPDRRWLAFAQGEGRERGAWLAA